MVGVTERQSDKDKQYFLPKRIVFPDKKPTPAAGEPMLVFCGFYGDRMNQALNAMRRTGLRIPYKAMLTAANRGWRPAELFAELQKEHAAMTAKR